MRAALYFHTLRHLRPIQVRRQLLQRVYRPRPPAPPQNTPGRRVGLQALRYLNSQSGAVSESLQFNFLNLSRPLPPGPIDWAAQAMPKLWRYNLHYFDYLLDPALAGTLKAQLIDDWIRANPPGTPDAWEPYPVSLRLVNWIKYFLSMSDPPPAAWLASLHAQAAWLERHLEYHLLANHLLKNAVALFFAGAYFEGPAADRWLHDGWSLFASELREQFLPDGGHFERSPMYHAIALLDGLDVLALAAQSALAARVDPAGRLENRMATAAQFLQDICLPDGDIPLFNDAALGIAPKPVALLAHAAAVLRRSTTSPGSELELIEKPFSGYYGFRHGNDMLLLDCGAVGPDYQPGHAHCDTLSYELALDGARVIVDSGVFEYAPGPRRHLCRSTAAHNTVTLDGAEQSEIWGEFRVARRARPLHASLRRLSGGGCEFVGSHDGYRRLRGRPIHQRRMTYDGAGRLEIQDDITGNGSHRVESRIRLHPHYRSVINGSYASLLSREGRPIARIEALDGAQLALERGHYFPEFGQEFECEVLLLRAEGPLPLRLGYRVIKGDE